MATSTKLDTSRLAQLLGSWSSGRGPLYQQLAAAVAALIEQGVLRDGAVLPPERGLADTLAVSRSTVVSAFNLLREQGHIERRQGSGSRVVADHVPGPDRGPMRSAPLFDRGEETRALLQAVPHCLLDLSTELRLLADAWPVPPENVDSEGFWPLRQAIAERYRDQGLPTDASHILVANGTQQACSLILAEVCRPGDVVLCESLTWPGLTDSVERLGARCHGVPMDDDGIIVAELRAAIERLRPAVVVVNPHHHNPTGVRTTPARRRELADIAADYGVLMVEDRVFADVAYDGVVPLPLSSHRPDAPIAVIDSLSKTVWCGLRIAWIRASPDLIGRLRFVKAIDDLGSATPSQLLALQLMPRLDDLVEQRRTELAERAAWAHKLITELLPDWTIPPAEGGASLWAAMPEPVVRPFVHHAARSGVLLVSDELFSVSKVAGRHIRLPFTAPEADIVDAFERLAHAWSTFDPGDGSPTRPGLTESPTLV
ncbi:MAG: PLP-dependent aminotransferase family protein [Actinomycetota bacterium]